MADKYEFETEPYEHQREALRASWSRVAFAYLMEMGTGKTKVAIDEMCIMREFGYVDGAVVLAPKGVYMNWVDKEIPAHLPARMIGSTSALEWRAGGGNKGHQRALDNFLEYPSHSHFRIFVMNIEALSSGRRGLDYLTRLMRTGRFIMYVDESTLIKNPDANRTKRVLQVGRLATHRRIMTGSPVTRSPLDLFSQFNFLDPGILGFRSYYAFRARYAVTKKMEFRNRKKPATVVVAYRNVEELAKKIGPHSYRVTKDQCLDLPEKIYRVRWVDMTAEQVKMYQSMRDSAYAELESGEQVVATEVIVQILRLQQLLCGHVKDEDGDVHPVSNHRVEAVMEELAEVSGKTIIWSRFRYDIREIVAAIKREYGEESVVEFHGGVGREERREATRRLQEDPACRHMVSNQQTGGYGNTWTAANTVIYYSNDRSLEKRLQSEDRPHRIGQLWPVTYVDLACRGTVDEKIIHAMRNMIDMAAVITGDNYKEWLV